MKKNVLTTIVFMLFMTMGCLICKTSSEASIQKWNCTNEITGVFDNITYNAYLSTDAKECWIYRIQINNDTDTIKFPNEINGAAVTKIGGARELLGVTADDELFIDILGGKLELDEGVSEFGGPRVCVKNLILPNSLITIGSASFTGFDKVENIVIPDRVESIENYAFEMCTSLTTVNLSQNLNDIDAKAFDNCSKLQTLTISSVNSTFKVKNNMLLSKDGKMLYLAAPAIKKVNIPKGVKVLEKEALSTSYADKINIPATVKEISEDSLSLVKAAKVTVNKKNKTFVKENDGIYNKKTGVLACIIVDDSQVVIPEKVKVINESISVLGTKKTIKKLTLPKSLRKLSGAWRKSVGDIESVYFKSTTPPVAKKSAVYPGYEVKPIFCKVYVPKQAKKKYIKWRLKGEDALDIEELWYKVIGY